MKRALRTFWIDGNSTHWEDDIPIQLRLYWDGKHYRWYGYDPDTGDEEDTGVFADSFIMAINLPLQAWGDPIWNLRKSKNK